MSAQDAKASVKVVNDTEEERTVEINKFPVRIKGKSEEIIVIPSGEFTYKIVGIDAEAQKRTVKTGETWGVTIRSSVTILPSDKELPPKVAKIDPKTDGEKWDRTKFARIVLKLPSEEHTVWVDGKEQPSNKTLNRHFITPELDGYPKWQIWCYKFSACWVDEKGNKKHVTQYVRFRCGEEVCVDFTKIDFSPPVYYFGPPVLGGCRR